MFRFTIRDVLRWTINTVLILGIVYMLWDIVTTDVESPPPENAAQPSDVLK